MDSTKAPGYSKPEPSALPSISATRRAIADRVIREAIAGYHAAERAHAEAEAAFGDDDELEAILSVVRDRRSDAERTLVRAVLNFDAERGLEWCGYKAEKQHWPARGVLCDGRLYMVTPDPDTSSGLKVGDRHPKDVDVMLLSVIPRSAIGDVGTLANDPVYRPDGTRIHHIDEELGEEELAELEANPESRWTTEAPGQGEATPKGPEFVPDPSDPKTSADSADVSEPLAPDQAEADWEDGWVDDSVQVIDTRPGRPVPEGRWEKRKLPLLRATHTLCAPWDNWPVSVEMVVLASEGAGDRTASVGDLPDLSLAGWHDHQYGPLTIYLRVVVA